MTDPMPATPGWSDSALDALFAGLEDKSREARAAFADCLAASKAPAAPSDLLGAEFEPCHAALRGALLAAGIDHETVEGVMRRAEALEADLAANS